MQQEKGLTKQRESYFDDSSHAIGLGHRTRPAAQPGGIPIAQFAGPLQTLDLEERAVIAANVAEDRERKIQALLRENAKRSPEDPAWTYKSAAEFVDREAAVPKGERPKLSIAEKRVRATEALMDVHKKPAKHSGSKSGRRRSGKCGTWICRYCHREWCEHRPKSRGGRPATSDRSLESHIRYSPLTAQAMRDLKLKPSDATEVFAIAWRDGVSIHAAVLAFRSRKGMAAQAA